MDNNEFNMLTGENTTTFRQLSSFEASDSHILQSLDYGTSAFCSCGALTKIMSATNLLRGRIITAVNNELDQYQQSMDLLLPSSKQNSMVGSCDLVPSTGEYENDLACNDQILSRNNSCQMSECGEEDATDLILNDLLVNASSLLLSKLK